MRRFALAVAVGILAVASGSEAWAQPQSLGQLADGDDPDHGVARISLLSGDVTVRRGDTGELVAGELNAPLVALDHVITGIQARTEVQLDFANMVRLGPNTEVRMGDLTDNNYLVQIAEGILTLRVLEDTRALVEISTPTISVRPIEKGIYRILVRPDGSTQVTVRKGQAEIFTSRGTERLSSGRTMEAYGTSKDVDFMISSAVSKDDWDRWNEDRDKDLERSNSYRYVSRDIPGAYDLDSYGRWVYDPPYGNVWVPNVTVSWAPYREGRWTYINYYGWTWLSGDPWGWAPYHYGRWYQSSYGWAWYPGVVGPRYYWRPALVGFFGWGGPSGGVNLNIGFAYGNVGWVPLAPYEVYRPWYRAGNYGYNGNRTTIINNTVINNTNVTNVYRNARQGNGVTSVRSGDFGRGRVNSNTYIRANKNDIVRAGDVRGQLPLEASRDSRRFSDREANINAAKRTNNRSDADFAVSPGRNRLGNNNASNTGNNSGNSGQQGNGPRGGNGGNNGNNTNTANGNNPNGPFADRRAGNSSTGSGADNGVTRGNSREIVGVDRGGGSRVDPNAGNTGPSNNNRRNADTTVYNGRRFEDGQSSTSAARPSLRPETPPDNSGRRDNNANTAPSNPGTFGNRRVTEPVRVEAARPEAVRVEPPNSSVPRDNGRRFPDNPTPAVRGNQPNGNSSDVIRGRREEPSAPVVQGNQPSRRESAPVQVPSGNTRRIEAPQPTPQNAPQADNGGAVRSRGGDEAKPEVNGGRRR